MKKEEIREKCAEVQDTKREKTPLVIMENEKKPNVGEEWNDKFGYVYLEKGCYMQVFVDGNYEGSNAYLVMKDDRHLVPKGDDDYLLNSINPDKGYLWGGINGWRNTITSYKCFCHDYEGKEIKFEEPPKN